LKAAVIGATGMLAQAADVTKEAVEMTAE